MKDLSNYMLLLRQNFHFGVEMSDVPDLLFIDKLELAKKIEYRDACCSNWQRSLDHLRMTTEVIVKDFSIASHRHSFSSIYSYQDKDGKSSGFIFSVSFISNEIGFYFYKFRNINDDLMTSEGSFEPFDVEMTDRWQQCNTFLLRNFIGFHPFNKKYSEIELERILIDGKFYRKLMLWNVLFTTNLGVIM